MQRQLFYRGPRYAVLGASTTKNRRSLLLQFS